MAKKSSQFPKGSKPPATPQPLASQPVVHNPLPPSQVSISTEQHQSVQPEQMSLEAHQHIQTYLNGRKKLEKDEVTAILRLSQHLRVFGLLSAVGYLNHAKDSGEVAKRTKPVWSRLLKSLTNSEKSEIELLEEIKQMAERTPTVYMATWRKSLILSKHWNFWAKAYQEE